MDGVRLGPGEGAFTAAENSNQPGMAAVPVCALPLNSPQNRVGGGIFISQPRIQSISNGWDSSSCIIHIQALAKKPAD